MKKTKPLTIHQSIQWFNERVKKSVIFIFLVYGQKAVTENALLDSYLFLLDTTKVLICLFNAILVRQRSKLIL